MVVLEATLGDGGRPVLCFLVGDKLGSRHLKTYLLDVATRELTPGPWSQNHVEGGASRLAAVPAPRGGVLVFGRHSVTYHSGDAHAHVTIPVTSAVCAAVCTDSATSRFLVGQEDGQLGAISFPRVEQPEPTYSAVGMTSPASGLAHISDHLFVASMTGDSQLVRIRDAPLESSCVEVVDVFENLGPVVDFALIRGRQTQVVTCSGRESTGTLRFVRLGVGFIEQAAVP